MIPSVHSGAIDVAEKTVTHTTALPSCETFMTFQSDIPFPEPESEGGAPAGPPPFEHWPSELPSRPYADTSSISNQRPSTSGSVASSGWEPRGDIRAEPSQERAVAPTPTHGVYVSITLLVDTSKHASFLLALSPITAGDQHAPPVERYDSAFFNPFSEHNVATQPRSSCVVGVDSLHLETSQTRLYSPASSLVLISRPMVEEGHDAVSPSPSVRETDSLAFRPGNAARKCLYHCSWSGCTKSYGTLDYLNAHIIMQRHGSKRTQTGEIHTILRD
jgi:hypothetical protein